MKGKQHINTSSKVQNKWDEGYLNAVREKVQRAMQKQKRAKSVLK